MNGDSYRHATARKTNSETGSSSERSNNKKKRTRKRADQIIILCNLGFTHEVQRG
jgi:hypothetical protein